MDVRLDVVLFGLVLLLAVNCLTLGLLMHNLPFLGVFNVTECWTCLFLGMVVNFTNASMKVSLQCTHMYTFAEKLS